ncbi:MAG: hypothetical protein M5U34_05945 [Chloroflexi bacterium]|nr:hypothetical protein [Chloroflexota bacterium]
MQIVETPGPLPPPFTPSSGPLMRQTAPAETAKVRQQLDGIPPGQPSDSSGTIYPAAQTPPPTGRPENRGHPAPGEPCTGRRRSGRSAITLTGHPAAAR